MPFQAPGLLRDILIIRLALLSSARQSKKDVWRVHTWCVGLVDSTQQQTHWLCDQHEKLCFVTCSIISPAHVSTNRSKSKTLLAINSFHHPWWIPIRKSHPMLQAACNTNLCWTIVIQDSRHLTESFQHREILHLLEHSSMPSRCLQKIWWSRSAMSNVIVSRRLLG